MGSLFKLLKIYKAIMIKQKMTRRLIWIGIYLCLANLSVAQVDRLSLNGNWEIIFDDKNEGVDQNWHLNERYDQHPDIRQITVPSCWEEYEKNYEGAAFYRKKFVIPEGWKDKIIELEFDASNYMTQVWLNEQVVGFHEGGYTPFRFRIDKLAKPGGQNVLTVRVISPIILTDKRIDGLGRQEVPMWRGAITGGIWQPVSLVSKGSVGIKDVFIDPNINTGRAVFDIEVENTKAYTESVEIYLRILTASGEEAIAKKRDDKCSSREKYDSLGNAYLKSPLLVTEESIFVRC
jgi:beta-galactosidase